ncbi:MAG: energy transducer TonB [Treponema sp.]|jgi:protein TonB|nr:energy transducer TonB [Treponema sp.]
MLNDQRSERRLRLALFFAVAVIHALLLFLIAFNVKTASQDAEENARVMKLTDLAEAPPPPPEEELPQVEAIAEIMIETDTLPLQTIVAPGSLSSNAATSWDDYLPIHKVSEPPRFDEREITAALLYPPIALRSAIEGRVILELFVDRNGLVQRITILQENPKERGFGEAAIRAFTGRRGTPAYANGEPVSARYRYPVSFKIK